MQQLQLFPCHISSHLSTPTPNSQLPTIWFYSSSSSPSRVKSKILQLNEWWYILNQSFATNGQLPMSAANSTDVSRSLPFQNLPFQHPSPRPQNLYVKNPVKPELFREAPEMGLFSSSSPENLGSSTRKGGMLEVFVSSAIALDKRQIEKIARKMRRLTGTGDLRMETTVDPTLIAGLVIRYDDCESVMTSTMKVIDLSVRGQLAELADRIETSDKKKAEQEQSWRVIN